MAQKFREQGLVYSNCGIWLNPRSAAALADPVDVDGAEVVFAVGVVTRFEVVEGGNLLTDQQLGFGWKACDALSLDAPASRAHPERLAALIVEGCDGSGIVGLVHVRSPCLGSNYAEQEGGRTRDRIIVGEGATWEQGERSGPPLDLVPRPTTTGASG
jgi:hypothetical protein